MLIYTANGATFADSANLPQDTVDDVDVASVIPAVELALDNTKFLKHQTEILSPGQIALIPSPANGTIRNAFITLAPGSVYPVGTFVFDAGAAGPDALGVANVNYIVAADSSGIWWSTAYLARYVSGMPCATGPDGAPLIPYGDGFGGNAPRFIYPQTIHVNVPLSSLWPGRPVATLNGGDIVDNVNWANYADKALQIRKLKNTGSAVPYHFPCRLPRGKVVGLSLVMIPNASGVAGGALSIVNLTAPMKLELRKLKNESEILTAGSIVPYDATGVASMSSTYSVLFTGTCDVARNVSALSGAPINTPYVQTPTLFRFDAGTTAAAGTCGGTAAVDVDGYGDYAIVLTMPNYSGGTYASEYPDGFLESVLRLEVKMEVQTMGLT